MDVAVDQLQLSAAPLAAGFGTAVALITLLRRFFGAGLPDAPPLQNLALALHETAFSNGTSPWQWRNRGTATENKARPELCGMPTGPPLNCAWRSEPMQHAR